MAEEVPETPSFEAWSDMGTLDITPVETPVEAEAVAETMEPETIEPEAVTETVEPETIEPEAGAETVEAAADVEPAPVVEDWYAPAEETATATETAEPAEGAAGTWGDETNGWTEPEPAVAAEGTDDAGDDVPRWAAGETPEGFPTGDDTEAGDPVDRGAIMAALEAAAEAVVAAESAAESAGQAEAAADVAETAAELLKGRVEEDELDPEAHAAMAARVDAGGVEESYTDRLAKLLPNHGDADGGSEPRTTAVIVSGLVSVASIASFKRHLGRIAGVHGVTVASGPDGEFVFNVTHLPDVSFRDALPTLPGFAARVTANADGTIHVTARDPEAEG
jgi:hypothetical protein